MENLVQSVFNGLLEEIIWKVAVLEFKRAKKFHLFTIEQEQSINDKKNGSEKNNSDTVHDCPVCGREVSATRFAPHLSKCLGIGARGQAAKKGTRPDINESEASTKSNHHSPIDLSSGSRGRQTGNLKRRGRPPKRPPMVPLTPAEHDALLSNAINNATQRLHLQGIGLPATASLKPVAQSPHPLSQSHVASSPAPKIRRKKKKDPSRHRSRNSSQASSSSDSEEEEVEEDDDEDDEEEGEEAEDDGEEREDDHRSMTPAGRSVDPKEDIEEHRPSQNPSVSPAPAAPSAPKTAAVLPRPVLKRRSSSQADSSDGSDSD